MAEKMRVGNYVGNIEHLNGRRALLRTDVEGTPAGYVLAQFDDPVTINGANAYVAMGSSLNFGWHKFQEGDFDMDLEFTEAD
jgi:hypothetical protein